MKIQGENKMLDEKPVPISYALRIAKTYYSEETYNHAIRVMTYVAENILIPYEYVDDCMSLAIMHDLIEDTTYPLDEDDVLGENFKNALMLLTKDDTQSYSEYIKTIHDCTCLAYGMCAWWVKLADIKDHFAQKSTLTDKLKEKYMNVLPYLL